MVNTLPRGAHSRILARIDGPRWRLVGVELARCSTRDEIPAASPGGGFAADGRLEVFAVGEDSALWHLRRTAPNGAWSQ